MTDRRLKVLGKRRDTYNIARQMLQDQLDATGNGELWTCMLFEGEKQPVNDYLSTLYEMIEDYPDVKIHRAMNLSVPAFSNAARFLFRKYPEAIESGRLRIYNSQVSDLEFLLTRTAVLLAFEQIGGADSCLEMAKAYSLERKAFGRPIGSFQAIKQKLADMYVYNELARSNTYYGAWAFSSGSADLPLAAAAARVSATDAFEYACSENIQTHGGIGYTWEADCHLYSRRSRALAVELGNTNIWKENVTSLLIQKLAQGDS